MKKFNKSVVTFVSVAAIVASLGTMPVFAVESDVYSVSYETLATEITADDGNMIPAGSVAVTMSINNNTGFNANTLTLDINEGYSVLTNADGKPILDKGTVLADALTSAAVSDDETVLCVSSASAQVNNTDGALFTVYFTADTVTATAAFISIEDTTAEIADSEIGIEPQLEVVYDSYFIGDTNGEDWRVDSAGKRPPVDATDAARILIACHEYGNSINLLSASDSLIKGYFPDVKHRLALDVNDNNVCDEIDANAILDYAAIVGAGNAYDGNIGKEIIFIKEII